MTRLDPFEMASMAGRRLRSSALEAWCAGFLADALDASLDPVLQRAAAIFRTAALDSNPKRALASGFGEIRHAYLDGAASGDPVRCHTAACYLALYFRALGDSNKVRTWVKFATAKASEAIDTLLGSDLSLRSRLQKMVEHLEMTVIAPPWMQVSAEMMEGSSNRLGNHRKAAAFLSKHHNHRIQQIVGLGFGKYTIPEPCPT